MTRDVYTHTEHQAAIYADHHSPAASRLSIADERGYTAGDGDRIPQPEDCVLGDCGRPGCLIDDLFEVMARRRGQEQDAEYWGGDVA